MCASGASTTGCSRDRVRSTSRDSSAGSCRWDTPARSPSRCSTTSTSRRIPRHAATDAMRSTLALAEARGIARPAARPDQLRTATFRRPLGSAASRSPSSPWMGSRRRSSHGRSPRSGSPTPRSIVRSRCSCGSRAAPGSCSISPRSDRSTRRPHRSVRSRSRARTRPPRCVGRSGCWLRSSRALADRMRPT